MEGSNPCLRAHGSPTTRILFFPSSDCEIINTWDSIGLRGTGSHDYAVADVFVPARRSLSFREPPAEPGPLYAMPHRAVHQPGGVGFTRDRSSCHRYSAGACTNQVHRTFTRWIAT